jgi:hypothetical protein
METPGRARFARHWVIAAAVAAAGLAACGGDSPKTTSAANGSPAATAPAGAPSTTPSTAAPCTFSGATDAAHDAADAPTRLLTDVRVGSHDCYERVTFEFKPEAGDADGPVAWKAAYEQPPITEDGSGRTVKVKGNAFLVVHMMASGADLTKEGAPDTYTGPTSIEAAGTTRIQQVRRTGDFEAVLTWVIGLDRQRPFHVVTEGGPARVVIDIGD